MSTSQIPSLTTSINYTLPALTLLLGSTALYTGYVGTTNPITASRTSGLPLSSPTPTATDRALFRAIGVRNIASGATLLGLVGLLGLARWDDFDIATTTIKRCIGVSLLAGVTAGTGDGLALLGFAEDTGDEEKKDAGAAHVGMSAVVAAIGVGWLVI